MTGKTGLPPGQYELDEFPRFGLAQFATRFPKETRQIQLTLTGDVDESTTVSNELRDLPRVDQTSDLVAFEERGTGVPGWILRYLYRPLVGPGIRQFRRALDQHLNVRL